MSNHPRVLASLSAYSCEGGFDGPYQPATCFTPTIALGRHSGAGAGEGLWAGYEALFDATRDAGLTGVCLEISWARLEPRRGHRDEGALERYAGAIAHARRGGLHVSVAVIDAAWPAWLGLEAWLMPWVVPVASDYVRWVGSSLDADAVSVFAAREQLTRGFLDDTAGPPWRRGATQDAVSAARNLDDIESHAREGSGLNFVSTVAISLDELGTAPSYDVDEIHVRSLVKGEGPLRSGRGLLERRSSGWEPVDRAIPSVLRRH